jgi:hypothetical protein
VRENIFVTSGLDDRLVVAIKERDIVRRTEAVAEVIESIKRERIIHLVIDPFVSTHRGVTENSNEEIEQVAEAIRLIAHRTGCSIDLVHHSLKPQGRTSDAQAGDMNAARGASSLIGAVRMIYTVSPMSEKTAVTMNVPADQAARRVRLDHAKGNYTARDGRVAWFELESYDIGNGIGPTDQIFCNGDTIAVPKPWTSDLATDQPKPTVDREAEREERLQRVRDFVVGTMTSDSCKLQELLPAIEQQFLVKTSAARQLLKDAIPPGEEAIAHAHGRTYSVSLDGSGAPRPLVVVRKLVRTVAEAA